MFEGFLVFNMHMFPIRDLCKTIQGITVTIRDLIDV